VAWRGRPKDSQPTGLFFPFPERQSFSRRKVWVGLPKGFGCYGVVEAGRPFYRPRSKVPSLRRHLLGKPPQTAQPLLVFAKPRNTDGAKNRGISCLYVLGSSIGGFESPPWRNGRRHGYGISYTIRPWRWQREIRSIAYRPARTNSTQEARTAGSREAFTSKALSQIAGMRSSRLA